MFIVTSRLILTKDLLNKNILALFLFMTSIPIYAQDESNIHKIEDIVVSGAGFTQKKSQTSSSVVIVSSETLEKMNIKELKELSSKIPGFYMAEDFNGGVTTMRIRGVGDQQDMYGRTVAVNIDGGPLTIKELQNFNLNEDIQKIEFFKGSQQIIYGPNGKAGAINIYTKKPTKSEGYLRLGVGNDQTKNLSLKYDHVFNDNFMLGGNFSYEKDGGWIENTFLNKKKMGFHKNFLSLKSIIAPTENTELYLSYLYRNDRIEGPFSVSADPTTHAPLNEIGGHKIPYYTIQQDTDSISQKKSQALNLKVTHDFQTGIVLESITNYTKFLEDTLMDVDGGNNPAQLSISKLDKNHKIFNQEIRLKNENGQKIKWMVGLGYYNNKYNNGIITSGLAFNGELGSDDHISGIGAFGKLSWQINDKFDLDLGLRYQHDSVKIKPKSKELSDINYKVSENTPLFSITSTYHLTPKIHFYGSIYQSYSPGGYYPVGRKGYEKEKGLTKELGFKAKWLSDRLMTSLTIFESKYKHRQGVNTMTFGVEDLGNERVRGIEMEGNYEITPNLIIGASYSFVNPVMTKHVIPQLNGKKRRLIPFHQANFNFNFNKDTSIGDISWRTDVNYTGSSYEDDTNKYKNKAYTLVDTSLSLTNKKHEIILWAKNIFNKKYLQGINLTEYNFQVPIFSASAYGRGRTFGLEYKYKF